MGLWGLDVRRDLFGEKIRPDEEGREKGLFDLRG